MSTADTFPPDGTEPELVAALRHLTAYAATGEHGRLCTEEAARDRAALLKRAGGTPYCEPRKAQALGLWAWADLLADPAETADAVNAGTARFAADWLAMTGRTSLELLPSPLRAPAPGDRGTDWPADAALAGCESAATDLRAFLLSGLGWGRTPSVTAAVGRWDQAVRLLQERRTAEAAGILDEVLERLPAGHWLRPTTTALVGALLLGESVGHGRSEPLRRRALAAARQACAEAPPEHPRRAWFLSLLELTSAPDDRTAPGYSAELDRAVDIGRQVVAAAEPADPDRVGYFTAHLPILAMRLTTGPDDDGRLGAELEELSLRIVDDGAADAPSVVQAFSTLAAYLTRRYQATGDTPVLVRARRCVARWAERTAEDPDRLGEARIAEAELDQVEFRFTGAVERLDAGIAHCRAVLESRTGGLARADARTLLGRLRDERRRAVGSSDGLDGPTEPLDLPTVDRIAGDPALAAIVARQIALRESESRSSAFFRAAERAVEAAAEGAPHDPSEVVAAAAALLAVIDRDANATLVTVVERYRDVVTKPGGLDLDALAALGRLMSTSPEVPPDSPAGRIIGQIADAVTAGNPWAPGTADLLRVQLANALPDTVREAEILSALIASGTSRYQEVPDPGLLTELVSYADRLVAHPAVLPSHLVMYARDAASIAAQAGDWTAAARLLGAAADSVPLLASPRLGRDDLERVLGRHAMVLGADACAAALTAGAPPLRAVQHLEAARGVLLAGGLAARTGLGDLHRVHPEHAAELEALLTADHGDDHDRRQADAGSRERLLRRIRRLPGFERLLLPPGEQELLDLGAAGPVVVLTTSHLRGTDALVIADGRCTVVPLPDAPTERVYEQAVRLDELTRRREQDERAQALYRSKPIADLLTWLWETVVEPVAETLGLAHRPGHAPSRLWWVPTGPFALLPLHAAGVTDMRGQDPTRTMLDRAVSSYTPTLRALHHTRGRSAPGAERPMLTVEGPGLQLADAETGHVRRLVPGTDHLDATTTADQVASRLHAYSAVHFSCHGYREDGLSLASGTRLTPRRVDALRLDGAQLAYLSACSTGIDSGRLLDEPLHPAAAFQLAGYRHVVGTLWPVSEVSAVDVAAAFYSEVRLPGATDGRIARGLAGAARRQRAQRPNDPLAWAGYQHIGP
ncbi:CHAT domain-containing protein [Kitasatospora sp. NPDC056184]|uniref:CHAT domain-containing protein n=1 Tax=Kitasatospora sp. NPDC056184 TaxID=3345738 RepID=UPI0035DDBD9D